MLEDRFGPSLTTRLAKIFWYLRVNSIDDRHSFYIDLGEERGTKGGLRWPRWNLGSPQFLQCILFPPGKRKLFTFQFFLFIFFISDILFLYNQDDAFDHRSQMSLNWCLSLSVVALALGVSATKKAYIFQLSSEIHNLKIQIKPKKAYPSLCV